VIFWHGKWKLKACGQSYPIVPSFFVGRSRRLTARGSGFAGGEGGSYSRCGDHAGCKAGCDSPEEPCACGSRVLPAARLGTGRVQHRPSARSQPPRLLPSLHGSREFRAHSTGSLNSMPHREASSGKPSSHQPSRQLHQPSVLPPAPQPARQFLMARPLEPSLAL